MFVAATLLRPMPPMASDHADTGLSRDPGGVLLRAEASADHVDVRDRPDRDDLRPAPRAVPVPDREAVPPSRRRRSDSCSRRSAVGALLGALTSGWTGRVRRQGLAVIVSVAAWGVAIAAFGWSDTFWLGLAMLALAGWADVISAIFRTTILQMAAPDRLARKALRDPHPRRDRRPPARRRRGRAWSPASSSPTFSVVFGRDRVCDRRGTRGARVPGAPPGSRPSLFLTYARAAWRS